ncbi:MAG TPA: hypothetical protein VHT52_12415, partial [Stellaceae bacterium]|nr:hypothetical protein [Stellaceae bacterium]
DVIAFVRDNFDDQPFDAPENARSYIDIFAAAARRSAKPHYLLTTRPGVMDRALVGVLRAHGVAAVGGFREGLMAIDRLARNANEGGSRDGWDRALRGRRQDRHYHAEPSREIERDQP